MKIGLVPQVMVNPLHPTRSVPYVPLGLLSLAGAVDRQRHHVEILDLTAALRDGDLPYSRKFERAAARLILSRKPDLVGFSSFSSTYHHTLKIAAELKALSPSTTIVLGGPQASFCHRETVELFPVDFVVRGEGEVTFPALLHALVEGGPPDDIPGLTFKRGGQVVVTPPRPLVEDLDTLPIPAFDLYPLEGHPKAALEITRGCPYRCTFCATSSYWRRRVRRKSLGRVVREMEHLVSRYDVKGLSFADDTFTIDRRWAVTFCEALIERRFDRPWLCSTRVDAVDEELLGLMARAGCQNIFYGIESGSERIQKIIRKNIRISSVLENLRSTARSGIAVTASLMMGFPDETREDLARTLRLRNRIQLMFPDKQSIQLHLLAPDVDTQITAENMDRIRYDGYHADHTGGGLARVDKDLVLRHRDMFIAWHYIEPKHLHREYLKQVHAFLSAAQLICYWSSLFVMLRDRDPLKMPEEWIGWFKEHPEVEGVSEGSPLLLRAVSSAAVFFKRYFKDEPGLPPSVRELFQHEYQFMRARGGAVMGGAAGPSTPDAARTYRYDPRETIRLIRSAPRRLATQEPRPTKVTYPARGGSPPRPR